MSRPRPRRRLRRVQPARLRFRPERPTVPPTLPRRRPYPREVPCFAAMIDPRTPVLVGVGTCLDDVEAVESMVRATDAAATRFRQHRAPTARPTHRRAPRHVVVHRSGLASSPAGVGAGDASTRPGRSRHPATDAHQRRAGGHRRRHARRRARRRSRGQSTRRTRHTPQHGRQRRRHLAGHASRPRRGRRGRDRPARRDARRAPDAQGRDRVACRDRSGSVGAGRAVRVDRIRARRGGAHPGRRPPCARSPSCGPDSTTWRAPTPRPRSHSP